MRPPGVSLVFPVRDEAENLEPLYERVTASLRRAGVSYELVFVDDGSHDRSLDIIKSLRAQDPCVRYLSLSRSFGHQAGLLAGMRSARGNAVIMMDADLQHPPELIPEMIGRWREGYEVVFTTKRDERMPWFWRWQMRAFYAMMSRLSGLPLGFGQSDFRLLDRKVVEVLCAMPEHRKFLRALVSWAGFKQVGLSYTMEERAQGRPKYSYRVRAQLALDGIFSFSALPLRFLLFVGLVVFAVTLPYLAWALTLGIQRMMGRQPNLPPGWVSVVVSVLWLGSMQLVGIGLLGEYLLRVYDETKGRPAFIVRECSDADRSTALGPEVPIERAREVSHDARG